MVTASTWGSYDFSFCYWKCAPLHHSLLWCLVDSAMETTLAAWSLMCEITCQCPALLGNEVAFPRSSNTLAQIQSWPLWRVDKYIDGKSPDHSYSLSIWIAYCIVLIYSHSQFYFDSIYYLWLSLTRIEFYFLLLSYIPGVDREMASSVLSFSQTFHKNVDREVPQMHIYSVCT